MTVFVGCPEGCRYHTASAVYDLVIIIIIIIIIITTTTRWHERNDCFLTVQ